MELLNKLKVSRRFALRGALGGIGVAMWLPVLDAMCDDNGTAFAAGEALPTTFGIWFWGNGCHRDKWTPAASGSGDAWKLPEALTDFTDLKADMTYVTGLDMLDAQFKGHGWGVVYVLAGGDGNMCTTTAQLSNLGNHQFETSQATQYLPTIDQIIADAIHQNEPYKSFETGMIPFTGDMAMGTPGSNIAHRGPNNVLPPRRDLKVIFDDLFATVPANPGGGTGGTGAGTGGTGATAGGSSPGMPSDISLKLRKSALDAVLEDCKSITKILGKTDQDRVASHMEGLRDLERQIDALSGVNFGGSGNTGGTGNTTGGTGSTTPTGTCTRPDAPATTADMTAKSQAMNRLLAAGLACNLTRVYSHMWSGPRSDSLYPTLSLTGGHHAYTHGTDADEPRKIEKYIMSQYADFCKVLKATKVGDTNLLDRTLLYGISDSAVQPHDHIMKDYHIVLMGHAGGKLPGNRHLRLVGRKVTELQLVMQQIMGMNVTTWGTWDRTTKTLSEIM
jgi:Protein of unknown function (DUF1552)